MVVAIFMVFLALFGAMWVRSWLGRAPYGGRVDGKIVAKNTVVHQSRYGARLEYFVSVSADGGVTRTAVPWPIYTLATPGSTLHQKQNVFHLTTPDGLTTNITAP